MVPVCLWPYYKCALYNSSNTVMWRWRCQPWLFCFLTRFALWFDVFFNFRRIITTDAHFWVLTHWLPSLYAGVFVLPYTCAFYRCVFACGISNLYIDTSTRIFALYSSDTAVTYVSVAGDFVANLVVIYLWNFQKNCGSFLLLYTQFSKKNSQFVFWS